MEKAVMFVMTHIVYVDCTKTNQILQTNVHLTTRLLVETYTHLGSEF